MLPSAGFVCNNFKLHIYLLLSQNFFVTKYVTMKQIVKYVMLVIIVKYCNTKVYDVRCVQNPINYFYKVPHLRSSTGFWICQCNKYNIFKMPLFDSNILLFINLHILYHKMIECETFIEVYLLLNWRTKSLQRQAINWQKSCSVELLRFSLKLFKILKITLVLKSHFKKEIGRPAHFLYSGTGDFVWVLQKF